MLQQIKIRNYKNFRDEIVFNLNTQNNYEFNKDAVKNGIINDAIIIGENASGKTNLGYGILDISEHLTDKRKRSTTPYTNLYNDEASAYFEYTFKFNGLTLVYKYEKKQSDKVKREELLIDRKSFILNDGEKKYVKLKGAESLNLPQGNEETISLVKYVYANTILDKNDKYSNVFMDFMHFVNGMLWFSSTEGNRYIGFSTDSGDVLEHIVNLENGINRLEEFLKEMGINYHLFEGEKENGRTIYCKMGEKSVPFGSVISSGTRSLVFFFLWYLQKENVSMVFVDEFDAFYHTRLASAVVEKLKELNDVQVIITTHNTDLITNDLLRPDCFFQLKENQIQPFSKLTDKALREAHNLQKMYKAGAFNE